MKSKKTKVLVIILCLTMVYMTTVYAATGFSENITQTKSIFSLPSNGVKGQFSEVVVKGNTLVNLPDWGGCETTTGWLTSGCSVAIDSSNNLFGTNCLKITLSAEGENYTDQDIFSLLKPDNYYLISLHFKNNNLTTGIKAIFVSDDNVVIGTNTDNTSYYRTGILIAPTDFDAASYAKLRVIVNGTTGQYGFVDAISILEISSTEYTEGSSDIDSLMAKKNYTIPGVAVSTKRNVLQSVGKNMFDGEIIAGKYIDPSDGIVKDNADQNYSPKYIKVKSSTQYTFSNDKAQTHTDWAKIIFYDVNKNFISGENSNANVNSYTINTPVNCKYIRISNGGNSSSYPQDKWQLEEGSIATSFVKYELSETFIPALPTKWDSFNSITGKLTLGGKQVSLTADNITNLYTSGTNIDVVYIMLDSDHAAWTDSINDNINFYGKEQIVFTGFDNTDNIGKYYTRNGDIVFFVVTKGQYTDTTDAKTNFLTDYNIGLPSLSYQLATPETTTYNTAPLACYKNGTVMVLPQVKESAAYNNGMSITNTNLPIKSLVRVDKIENGVLTPVDLSNATIAPDGLSFTIPGAVNGETYIYVYEYASELSTIPTITYSVPINQDGQITGNTNAIQRHSDLIDIILQQIQLMRQEIQELKTMLQ